MLEKPSTLDVCDRIADELLARTNAAITDEQLCHTLADLLASVVPSDDRRIVRDAAWLTEVLRDDGPAIIHHADQLPSAMQSGLVVPLRHKGDASAALLLLSRRKGHFTRDHMQVMGRLANAISVAAELVRLGHLAARQARALQHHEQAAQEADYLKGEIKAEQSFTELIGDSPAMQQVRRAILQVAQTDSTVLILGETGTGKELIARALHKISHRRQHLLVKVNCAALAPGVIASELFGHEAGAFTGAAKRRLGRFELAQRGSLFLDEIGEIPADIQVLLLRVLQERVIERVGSNDPIAVDVRVIAATHRDLPDAVRAGQFRADLFYRLNVFPLRVPPLRERADDIPALVDHFVHHFARRLPRTIRRVSLAAMDLLMGYSWPGNIRELENVLERAMIVATGEELQIDPTWLAAANPGTPVPVTASLAQVERDTILDALAACRGKIYGAGGAAAKLGLKPSTLYGKMRKLGIAREPAAFDTRH